MEEGEWRKKYMLRLKKEESNRLNEREDEVGRGIKSERERQGQKKTIKEREGVRDRRSQKKGEGKKRNAEKRW